MRKIKKSLAVLLAVLMLASFTPLFASAADPIALTEANVTVWPTVSGEIYYGQKINEGITLSGGEVQYNGTVVAGHFEFIDPELRTNVGIPNLKFVPDDTTAYSVSEIGYAWDLMFTINKTTPVFVDANDTPVATEVASAGTLLGKSKISGGQVMNPYYPEEASVLGYTWSWVNRREPVTKSGYYEAQLGGGSYNTITTMIYVKIAGDAPETSITEMPTIPELSYNPDMTWADVEITGGKAVINETEEVAGTFAISDSWKNKVPAVGSYNVSVVFTPDDLTKASVYTMLIPVTVNQGTIKFVDENGNEFVPEIRVPYGTKLDDGNFVPLYIESIKTNYDGSLKYMLDESIEDTIPEVGTYEYTVKLSTYKTIGVTPDYADSVLPFRLIVEPITVEMTADMVIHASEELAQNERYYRFVRTDGENVQPKGTYDVYIDGELYADDVKTFKWLPTASKNYEFRVIYNPVENDPFTVNEWTQNERVTMWRNIKFDTKNVTSPFKALAGSEVTVKWTGANEDFMNWVITDTNGNPVDVDIKTEKLVVDENGNVIGKEIVDGDYTSTNIIFTMPDTDIEISTKDTAPEDGKNDNSLWSFWQKLINFIIEIYRTIDNLFHIG